MIASGDRALITCPATSDGLDPCSLVFIHLGKMLSQEDVNPCLGSGATRCVTLNKSFHILKLSFLCG